MTAGAREGARKAAGMPRPPCAVRGGTGEGGASGPGRASRRVALVYLLVALTCSIHLAVTTVPYDAADEPNQFLRATQVGQGGVFALKLAGGDAGGRLPIGVIRSDALDRLVHGLGHDRIARPVLAPYRTIPWGRDDGPVGFQNTATYGPVMYGPAAAAIDLGRRVGWRVLATLRAARVANAVCASALASVAILIADAGLPFLVLVLMLPMTLFLFGSASQDATLIGCGAVVAAWLSRRASGASAGWSSWLGIGAVLGAMAMGRPPYAILAAIFVALTFGRPDRFKGLASAVVTVLLAAVWFVLGIVPLGVPTRAGGSLLDGAQMQWILRHDRVAALVFWRTAIDWPTLRFREFVGVLGWLDIALPERIYRWGAIASVATLAIGFWGPRSGVVRRVLVLSTLLLTVVAIYVALYLSWTRIGAGRIDGIQGRYFTPLAPFLILLGRARPGLVQATAALIVIACSAAVEVAIVFPAVAAHLVR